jgi:hypothetical protein
MFCSRIVFTVLVCIVVITPVSAEYSLRSPEQKILEKWLAQHPEFRVAADADCACAEDIQQTKTGDGGNWPSVPDYHPYTAVGDFNSDGVRDLAIVVVDRSKSAQNFTLLVFNGPLASKTGAPPAFVASGLDLRGQGLFFGPPRPKPYRLVIGPFESDNTAILVPRGLTYTLRSSKGE